MVCDGAPYLGTLGFDIEVFAQVKERLFLEFCGVIVVAAKYVGDIFG